MLKPIWFLSPDETGGSGAADAGSATAQNEGAENNAAEQVDAEANSSAGTENADKAQGNKATKARSDYIPYDRFHEVNTKYRESEASRSALETELRIAREQLAAAQRPAHQDDTDPEVKRTIDFYGDKMVKPAITPLTQRLEKIEEDLKARDESAKLEKAIGEVETRYPAIKDMPLARQTLMNEYIMNPKANLEDMAKSISSYLTDRDKKVIDTYVKGKTAAGAHKGATPPGAGPAQKSEPLPKNASVNDVFRNAEKKAAARIENANK